MFHDFKTHYGGIGTADLLDSNEPESSHHLERLPIRAETREEDATPRKIGEGQDEFNTSVSGDAASGKSSCFLITKEVTVRHE